MKNLSFLFLLLFILSAISGLHSDEMLVKQKGFSEGNIFVFTTGGVNLSAPNGSFIRHEKIFDQTQNFQITQGTLKYISPLDTFTPYLNSGNYNSNGFFSNSLEYAQTDNFAWGAAISGTSVDSKRIETLLDPRDGNQYILPVKPGSSTQLSLTALTLDLSWHFLENNKIDPFISVHAGPVFVAGIAHKGFAKDALSQDEKIHNGRGITTGASFGLNFHFNRFTGIRTDISYRRYDFQADEFSTRSYYNTFVNLGLFVKM